MSATNNLDPEVPVSASMPYPDNPELSKRLKEMNHGQRKKIVYFSDGSTMQIDFTDVDRKDGDGDEIAPRPVASESETPVNPKELSWPQWFKHYSYKGGSTVLSRLENAGESLAYFFGITTPKYQPEIDEYHRTVAQEKAEEEEAKAWASTDPMSVPIIMEQIKRNQSQPAPSVIEPPKMDQ